MSKGYSPIDLNEAISIVRDPNEAAKKREDWMWYLEKDASERSIQTLVAALTDDDFGVRWVAATALTRLGDKAIPFVLEEIIQHFTLKLRDSVYHVLHYNYGVWTQWHVRPLMDALKSLVPDVTAPKVAYELLMEFEHSRQAPQETVPASKEQSGR
ncbi:MAG: hypothetical protein PVF49_00465 [Anaerolineales bacterium]|jgi:hypothetical protein